jgi:hypothetical protein
VLKVVATIESPMSHHGAARPDVKNSVVLELARRAKNSAGRNEMTIEVAMMAQSSGARFIWGSGRERAGAAFSVRVQAQGLEFGVERIGIGGLIAKTLNAGR